MLLDAGDPPVFHVENPTGSSSCVLTCDHAGRAIPRRLANLGLSPQALSTHIAWDIGVAALGRRLAARLDAVAIAQSYSRLVIDANRPPGVPDSIATRSERTTIAANEGLSADDARQRVDEVFLPYHQRIRDELDARRAAGRPSVLVALHSFTPVFMDGARRWHAGVLYGRDPRLARLLLDDLRRDGALVVGDNEPYAVSDATDYSIVVHGEQRGIPHVELEIRQDLLASDAEVDGWAERLGSALEAAVPRVSPG
ncbi:MAG TPA: N-formylglutamate amidohydrolase [Candidatus Binatia bacterium]|jgi:predicted N-formylglutamate amidohydrolase|nr:N-formylglutamate amidohydrolase [Candidatus Binatia bacterium]